ncbi:YbaB/EbfC family nucleoid-associated protein [Crossiella sp. SN42]|uniref:YbaB/EbfC family nucleoid-associated protein n=1 Tax=unclassified Crossiella TaxID=2620835 RepID=UPI00207D4D6A|nr:MULTISPECIES: YbaB/EbfC family nucleoid-associated protein [unclassified Crossiella]MCO1577536.1 YbaB/EbfC family nucleoid-associated protein [Crossiella sp. SN42]WHT22153.1 YbaB/EbfC family nucleoid-associated protein [Crossiella sp. CA-258035]
MDPEAWVARMERENRARLAAVDAVSGELQQLSGRASTPDGKISVEVHVNGTLKDVQIHPSLVDASLRNLGQLLVQLAQQAQAQAGRQLEEVVTPLFGDATQTMAMLRGYLPPAEDEDAPGQPGQPPQAQREPNAPPRPSQPPRQPRPDRDEDEDDFGGPILR